MQTTPRIPSHISQSSLVNPRGLDVVPSEQRTFVFNVDFCDVNRDTLHEVVASWPKDRPYDIRANDNVIIVGRDVDDAFICEDGELAMRLLPSIGCEVFRIYEVEHFYDTMPMNTSFVPPPGITVDAVCADVNVFPSILEMVSSIENVRILWTDTLSYGAQHAVEEVGLVLLANREGTLSLQQSGHSLRVGCLKCDGSAYLFDYIRGQLSSQKVTAEYAEDNGHILSFTITFPSLH